MADPRQSHPFRRLQAELPPITTGVWCYTTGTKNPRDTATKAKMIQGNGLSMHLYWHAVCRRGPMGCEQRGTFDHHHPDMGRV